MPTTIKNIIGLPIKRNWKFALILSYVCGVWAGTPALAEVYRSAAHRFSFTVPTGWEQVPNHVLQTSLMAIKQQSKEAAFVDYDSAFQPQGISPYMSGPRMLVQIGTGRIPYRDLESLASGSTENTLNRLATDLGAVASSVNSEDATYNRTRQMIIRCAKTSIFTSDGIITQNSLSVLKLTKYGFVGLHFYAPTAQWNKYCGVFQATIDSLSIDPKVALHLTQNQRPTSQSDPIQRGVRGAAIGLVFGLVGCTIALLLFLVRTLWKKKKEQRL